MGTHEARASTPKCTVEIPSGQQIVCCETVTQLPLMCAQQHTVADSQQFDRLNCEHGKYFCIDIIYQHSK